MFFKRKKEPVTPYIQVEVRRKGKTIEKFNSNASPETQLYNYSKMLSIFQYYKVEIIHDHSKGEVYLLIEEKKNDEIFPAEVVENKKNEKK